MNGRAEVGLPGALLGATVLLAALSPVLLPVEVVVIDPLDGPAVTAPAAAVALVAVLLAAGAVVLARRWARLARSRRPATMALGTAHALAWAGVLLLGWPVALGGTSWFHVNPGMVAWILGATTGWAAARHRPRTVAAAVRPTAHDGAAAVWTGHARLTADVAAPLLVFVLLVGGPPYARMLYQESLHGFVLPAALLFVLLVYNAQLRALWVTVTVGANGIRIRTGPFGQVQHRRWDQIGVVEVLEEELPGALWARRFERRYVLRPGPALRIGQPEPYLPTTTVSVDHADQAAAIAARHLADRAPHRD